MEHKYRFVIAACARWETPYIVEWLNYQRAIGFEHIYLYCNDDDPLALYEEVLPFTQGTAPFVTFRFYPVQGMHRDMMLHFLKHSRHDSEWICFLDADEFIRLPIGQTVAEFMAPFEPMADCVMFNWVFFGPNGHKTPPPENVLTAYTRRSATVHQLTKHISRSTIYEDEQLFVKCRDNSFVHRLSEYCTRKIRSVNVLGEDMTAYYERFRETAEKFVNEPERQKSILEKAIIHHYAFRSEQAFMDRVARGLKGDFAAEKMWGDMAQDETKLRGFINAVNRVEDNRLADFWQNLKNQALQTNVFTDAVDRLISRKKPAMQSSVSPWSASVNAVRDAAGAVNGNIDGKRKFHTAEEENPWWQVDLGTAAVITEVRIYNTTEAVVRDRFQKFKISIGFDQDSLVEIFRKDDDLPVHGIDSRPFIWKPESFVWGRCVRITLLGRGFLHLDQVEVYGRVREDQPG